jgi:3-phosphoshikimate 1-carboxyvinyltransferase
LTGVLFAEDTRLMLDALQKLGYELEIDEPNRSVWVGGGGPEAITTDAVELDLRLSGTCIRFLTAAACLSPGLITLDGNARMRERPIGELVDALKALGADIRYTMAEGCPPIEVGAAQWTERRLELPTMQSSQYISSLLQIGPYLPEGLELELGGLLTSQPYIRMTVKLMQKFGAKVDAVRGYRGIRVASLPYRGFDYEIEPDASNASYFLAAAAIVPGSRVTVSKLGSESLQGDAGFCDVLGRMGCGVEQTLDDTTVIAPVDRLRGITVDLNGMPDLAMTLAAVAVFAEGPTFMRNVGTLRVKETDRIQAIINEWTKWGCRVVAEGTDLAVHPPERGPTPGVVVDTYDDHRMAMSAAVVALRAEGVTINNPGCTAKTYPEFFEDFSF